MINVVNGKCKMMICNPTEKPTKCYVNKKLGKFVSINDDFVYSINEGINK